MTVIDYSLQYKFNRFIINSNALIDLNKELEDEQLYLRVGLFLEESEIIFLEIEGDKIAFPSSFFEISFEDIKSIRPLSEQATPLVRLKIGSTKISKSIDRNIANRIINYRDKMLAERGSDYLLKIVEANKTSFLLELEQEFLKIVNKYHHNVHFTPDSIFEYILKYERSKPFPMNDLGFMLDCGSILKSNFDYDPLNKKEIIEMRKLFQPFVKVHEELGGVRGDIQLTSLIHKLSKYPEIKELNEQIKFVESNEYFNYLATIMIYLKLRSLIREGYHEKHPRYFVELLKRFKADFGHDALNAFVMLGMRFGIQEFVTLFEIPKEEIIEVIPLAKTGNKEKKKTGKGKSINSGSKNNVETKKEKSTLNKHKEPNNIDSGSGGKTTKRNENHEIVEESKLDKVKNWSLTEKDAEVDDDGSYIMPLQ